MEQFHVVVENPALFDRFANPAGKDVQQLTTNHRVEQRLHFAIPSRVAVPEETPLFLRVNDGGKMYKHVLDVVDEDERGEESARGEKSVE